MNTKPQAVRTARSRYAHTQTPDTKLTRAVAEALEPRRLLATFVVNTTADTVDADPNVTSLREAIAASNNLPGVDHIEFNIGAGGPQTIRPTTPLPSILTGVVLDARTQPGYAGKPIIQLSGELAGANADGLRVGSLGSSIRGLVISNFSANGIQVTALANGNTIAGNYLGTDLTGASAAPNARGLLLRGFNNTIGGPTPEDRNVISGNASTTSELGRGIEIGGASATANVILGNYVGVNAAGTAALTNTGDGISVIAGAHDNLIGGDTPASRNVISGNRRVGIWVNGPGTTANLIQGNFIGTNPAGTAAIPNAFGTDGTFAGLMFDNAPGNTAANNVISGNRQSGLRISNSSAYNNRVTGNRIGTNAAGTAAVPNAGDGVSVQAGAFSNLIGGAAPGDGNLISGNGRVGIWVNGPSTYFNAVQGNYIGTDATGAAPLGNGFATDALPGVMLDNAPYNTVGGAELGAGNVISANKQAGVTITGSFAYGNRVAGNRIGTTADGASPLGNVGPGVLVQNGASNNAIGGSLYDFADTAPGNVIAFNAGPGVLVTDNFATANAIRFNAIHDNAGLGIDLGNDGVTPNDLFDNDSGPNSLQNTPVIDSITDLGGGQSEIAGRLFSGPFNSFSVDLYASPAGNPGDATEGARYLGSTFAYTDETGYAAFTLATDVLAPGQIVTATATTYAGTSEFSSRVTADPGGPYLFAEGLNTGGVIQLAATALDLGGSPATYAWDLDNDGLFDDSTSLTPTLILPDDGPLDRVVSLRVTNGAGQSAVNSTVVRIVNVPPSILDLSTNSTPDTPLAPGAPAVISGHFTDPGLLDTHTATIDWGDGTVETLNVTRPAGSADGSFSFAHTYTTGGVYTPFIVLADDDGGQSFASSTAYVTGAGVQFGVLNVVGTTKSDNVTLTANPDGSVTVNASFLSAPANFAPNDFYFINVLLSGKNDQASVVGPLAPFVSVGMSGGDGNDTLSLGQAGGYLFGGPGNDVLTGGANFTQLYGEDGNDALNAGTGYTYAYGGLGNDTITGNTSPNAQGGGYYGDDGNDVITGSAANEYIGGGNGNDNLAGGGGDDYLFGDAGNDTLHGNAGNDVLFGGNGTDQLFGDAGDDYLQGDAGADLLNGGAGTDTWGDPWDTTDTRTSLELP